LVRRAGQSRQIQEKAQDYSGFGLKSQTPARKSAQLSRRGAADAARVTKYCKRRGSTTKDKACFAKPIEHNLKFSIAFARDRCQELVGEFPSNGGTDLRYLPFPCAEAIEPR
jgi:hypothetical protein